MLIRIGINSSEVCGIPVRELAEFATSCSDEEKKDLQILIATPENVMDDIEKSLEKYGFHNYVRLNSERWADMQRNAFVLEENFRPIDAYPVGFTEADLHIYKAKFYKERVLKANVDDPSYVCSIQVGSALTEVIVADVLDNTGDNISDKNGNYSELTGLYWIWMNRIKSRYYGDDCYYGLVHYQRLFDLSEDDLLRVRDNDIGLRLHTLGAGL